MERDRRSRARMTGLILLVALLGIPRAGVSRAEALLDGLVFVGHTGPLDGSAIDGEDEIIFRNGRFRSTACDTWGFNSPAYTVTREGDMIHFQAVTTSPRHGQIQWRGTVKGDVLEASYLWTKARWYWFDAREERRFRGTIKRD
jgi:hypothetical protein